MENKLSGTSGSAAELVAHVAQEGWEGLSDTSWLVTQCLLRSEMKSRQGVGAEVCWAWNKTEAVICPSSVGEHGCAWLAVAFLGTDDLFGLMRGN